MVNTKHKKEDTQDFSLR